MVVIKFFNKSIRILNSELAVIGNINSLLYTLILVGISVPFSNVCKEFVFLIFYYIVTYWNKLELKQHPFSKSIIVDQRQGWTRNQEDLGSSLNRTIYLGGPYIIEIISLYKLYTFIGHLGDIIKNTCGLHTKWEGRRKNQ